MPRFSVLMPAYNFGHFIVEAVSSVLAQTDSDWELIVVDDGSTDGTWDILSAIDHPQVTAIRHERNQGISAAFNTALAEVTGEWICNLDSDDRYLPTFLQRQREYLDAHPEVDATATWVREIDAQGRPVVGTYEGWFNRHWDLNDPASWVYQNPVCHNSTVVRRTLHDRLGGEHTGLRSSVDWEKWVRLIDGGARFGLIPEVLVETRVHGANMSGQATTVGLKDWAALTRDTLDPWLQRIGRKDLAEQNLAHFLREPSLAQVPTDQLAELLGTATGLDPASLTQLAGGVRGSLAMQRERDQEVDAAMASYAAHVETLLADFAVVEAELAAARAELTETRIRLESVLESRSYRLGQAVRRALP